MLILRLSFRTSECLCARSFSSPFFVIHIFVCFNFFDHLGRGPFPGWPVRLLYSFPAKLTQLNDSIFKDKISNVSVKLKFSQEDAWARALRHVLLALKILLKWATSGNNA